MNARVTDIERVAFQNRIKKINNRNRNVWDCIDRPIKPLVFELARIGMIPKFSCCGYSYENEEEPKSHHNSVAYVHFYAPEQNFKQFEQLIKICKEYRWGLDYYTDKVWHLYIRNCVPDNLYMKKDGIPEAIHQYEGYGLQIETLAGVIQDTISTQNDPVHIIDGNIYYEHLKNWIIRPKKDFYIGVKEYYRKYGQINTVLLCTPPDKILGLKLMDVPSYTGLKADLILGS
jgi:hypothetical protein